VILVDTSVWVDHLRRGDSYLAQALERGAVAMHPFVLGEIACGSLKDRQTILTLLGDLPSAVVATGGEVLSFIEHHGLHARGIGYVDVHLLASAALSENTTLWTRDKRLQTAAQALRLSHSIGAH
jgi:predicted nucleic acid-binding protein